MKTKYLILSIALVALATTSFSQRASLKERLFHNQNNRVEYITAKYSKPESSRIESWMHDLHSWASCKATRNNIESPVVTRTIVLAQADIVYEEEIGMENWMATTYECCYEDDLLSVESWMVAPFESTLVEEELILESWMTTPFEVNETIELEAWI